MKRVYWIYILLVVAVLLIALKVEFQVYDRITGKRLGRLGDYSSPDYDQGFPVSEIDLEVGVPNIIYIDDNGFEYQTQQSNVIVKKKLVFRFR